MGAESFFFNLIPEGVMPIRSNGGNSFIGVSNIETNKLVDKLIVKYHLQQKEDHWLIVESIAIDLISSEQKIQAISIVGCFSWFEECLQYCFELSNTIGKCIEGFKYFFPGRGFVDINNADEFKEVMLNIYSNNYKSFISTFGQMNKRLAPGREFYSYLRTRRSIMYRIIKKLSFKDP